MTPHAVTANVTPQAVQCVRAMAAPEPFSMIDQQAGLVVKLARILGEVLQGKESAHSLRLHDLEQRRRGTAAPPPGRSDRDVRSLRRGGRASVDTGDAGSGGGRTVQDGSSLPSGLSRARTKLPARSWPAFRRRPRACAMATRDWRTARRLPNSMPRQRWRARTHRAASRLANRRECLAPGIGSTFRRRAGSARFRATRPGSTSFMETSTTSHASLRAPQPSSRDGHGNWLAACPNRTSGLMPARRLRSVWGPTEMKITSSISGSTGGPGELVPGKPGSISLLHAEEFTVETLMQAAERPVVSRSIEGDLDCYLDAIAGATVIFREAVDATLNGGSNGARWRQAERIAEHMRTLDDMQQKLETGVRQPSPLQGFDLRNDRPADRSEPAAQGHEAAGRRLCRRAPVFPLLAIGCPRIWCRTSRN